MSAIKCQLLSFIILVLVGGSSASAQTNSRNWVNIQQAMIGGTASSMTSSAFSAFNSVSPFKYYSLAVGLNGVTTSAWTVNLDGSNDGAAWTTLLTNTSVLSPSGGVVFQSNAQPVLYLRVSSTRLGTGNQITATAVGVP
jgi:hypothetical protein